MARIEVSRRATENLRHMVVTLNLPDDTSARVRRSLRQLGLFPRLGAQLGGRWSDYRFLLGPWRWMIIVYAYLEETDRVAVLTIQDARSGTSVTAEKHNME